VHEEGHYAHVQIHSRAHMLSIGPLCGMCRIDHNPRCHRPRRGFVALFEDLCCYGPVYSVAKTHRMPKVAGHVSPKGPFGAKEPLIIRPLGGK